MSRSRKHSTIVVVAALISIGALSPQLVHGWQTDPAPAGEPSGVQPAPRFRTPDVESKPLVRDAPEAAAGEAASAPSNAAPSNAAGQTADETDPLRAIPRDIQTASFQGVVPGQSTLAEVKQALGEPLATQNAGGASQMEYRVGPFPKVEITAEAGVATSIVIHLSRAAPPAQVAQELKLNEFRPAAIDDESGRPLGEAYPERGVLFVFAADQAPPAVSHIVLEPISAEPFILRAQSDRGLRYRDRLADLNYAQQLAPADARIFGRRAELLCAAGRIDDGLTSIAKAVELEPENLAHRVVAAELYIAGGQHKQALQVVEAIAARETAPLAVRARAELLWGDILAAGAGGDFQAAVQHHTRCIDLAMKMTEQENDWLRRAARELALDAHLAIARDIAWGNWQNKEPTVNKWLSQAEKLAESALAHGEGDSLLRLEIQRGKLAALAGARSSADPAPIVAASLKSVRDALAANDDTLFQSQVMWELGEAMFHASLAAQLRGSGSDALKFGNQALALLDEAAQLRDASAAQRYLRGQACFRMGALYAVNNADHARAVEWYQKALLLFADGLPDAAARESALHGERYVSMGASYWKAGQQDAGLKLTEQGVQLIEQAVRDNKVRPEALAIPYGNLAAMHRQSGNSDEADELVRLAERLEAIKDEDSASDKLQR